MDQFINVPLLENITDNEYDTGMREDTLVAILLDISQNLGLTEELIDFDEIHTEDTKTLHDAIIELGDITLNFLSLKIILINILRKRNLDLLDVNWEDIKEIHGDLESNFNETKKHEKRDLRSRLEFLIKEKKELEDLTQSYIENIIEDIQEKFVKYQSNYKKCEFYLKRLLEQSQTKLKINIIPRHRQEELCIFLTVLQEGMDSYNFYNNSSKRAFRELKILLNKYYSFPEEDWNNRYKLLISAIGKSKTAFDELKPIVFEILIFDCITSVLNSYAV